MNSTKAIVNCCFALAITILIAFAASSASAESMCVDLTESNRLSDGRPFVSVTLSYIYNSHKRGVRISVKENDDVLSPRPYAGIRRFGFNTTVKKPELNLKVRVPREWTRRFMRYSYGAFGRFNVNVSRRMPALGKKYNRLPPLIIDVYHRTGDLSFSDFIVFNDNNKLFAARIAHFMDGERYYKDAFFAAKDEPGSCEDTTTTTLKPSTTTTVKPGSTTTIKPTSTTTSRPGGSTTTSGPMTTTTVELSSTTTVQPATTSTSSISASTSSTVPPTSVSTTSSVSATTTSQPATTSSLPLSTTTSLPSGCTGEIYKGGTCDLGLPIDDPAYNRPGRRGLALTCEDVVDFCVCTDCVNNDPACLVWSIEPAEPYVSFAVNPNGTARLSVGESCQQLEDIREYTVTVTDTCNEWSDSVVIELGKVTIDIENVNASRGSDSFEVPVSLVNQHNSVKALTVDLCECDGGEDRVTCDSCAVNPDRALEFNCSAHELDNGCCRVVIYATDPSALILEGTGRVFDVIYEAADECEGCVCLRPVNPRVSDRFNEELCACQSTGDVCFRSCGDVYPQDCLNPGCTSCGDDVVNLFDILETVDIILGYQTPTACQLDHGDVPNGKPPYCGAPAGTLNCGSDGDIDVLDLLVIIDMAQGRANCCDYCLFKKIY